MKQDYPDSVIDKILQVTLNSQSFGYLSIDEEGTLLSKGGEIGSMSLPDWQPGDDIRDTALFLVGYLPMTSAYECIESFQLGAHSIMDVHFFNDGNSLWIVLVDKTSAMEWQALARQKANDVRLLQKKVDDLEAKLLSPNRQHTHFDFFESLNMTAMRVRQDGSFELLEPVSDRFKIVYPEAFDGSGQLQPQEKFPLVENFLIDANELWRNSEDLRRIRSGPWVETIASGEELALEAIALNWSGQKLLFIKILDENYQLNHNFLQVGREGALMKNILEEEVRKQTRQIRLREEEIALRLVCAADSRDDGETGSHIRRLGLYSELLAKYIGWSDESAEEIRIAAPMHDIGKIGIPDHILRKPGKLTESEFDIMKLHPEIGGRILSNSSSPLVQMAREICMGHHEKWNGSGYPRGLAGEDIPQSARIVAIVDVFDALLHKRVYKEEMGVDESIKLMIEGRGTHFDPILLDKFVELKAQMVKISADNNNPVGEDPIDTRTVIDDIHLNRPMS